MAMAFASASTEYLDSGTVVTAMPLTMACHFYITTEQFQNILHLGDADQWDGWVIYQSGAGASYTLKTEPGLAESAAAPSTNAWHTAVAVHRSTTDRSLWLDGTEYNDTSNQNPAPSGIDTGCIGAALDDTNSPYSPFDGYIAEVAFWDVALDDAEIAAYDAGVSPALIRPGSLVSYVPLVRDSGGVIDRKGIAWTINGTPTDSAHPALIMPAGPRIIPVPAAAVGGTTPHGPLGHPFYGPFAGPVAA